MTEINMESLESRTKEFNRLYFEEKPLFTMGDPGTQDAWCRYGFSERFKADYADTDLLKLTIKDYRAAGLIRSLFFEGAIWQREKHNAGLGSGSKFPECLALGVVFECERGYDKNLLSASFLPSDGAVSEGDIQWAPAEIVRLSDGLYARWKNSHSRFQKLSDVGMVRNVSPLGRAR